MAEIPKAGRRKLGFVDHGAPKGRPSGCFEVFSSKLCFLEVEQHGPLMYWRGKDEHNQRSLVKRCWR